ncbi:MAG: MATE family efflux transporter [Spirochaetota bacterium]
MNRRRSSTRLGTEPVLPLLFRLALPSIAGMASQALYNVVDSIYVGHISKEALSALTLAFPIQMVLIAIAVGTGVGATSLISRSLGAGERDRAREVAEHAVLAGLFFGAAVAMAGVLFAVPVTRLFTQDPHLVAMTSSYIRIIMVGSAALFIPIILMGILRGEGNTFLPMLAMSMGAAVNIGLDPLFIFGIWVFPALGVEGAAWATVLSRFLSGLFITASLLGGRGEVRMRPGSFRLRPGILRELYRVGLPAMSMQLLASVMLAGGNLILATFSTTAIAVFGIFFRLQAFIFMPVFGLGQGVMPITGYNYGAGEPGRMKQTVQYGMVAAFLFTLAGFMVFQLIPRGLVTMFNRNPELVAMGVPALRRISLGFLFVGPTVIGVNVFQALGRGAPSFLISVLRTVVLILPLMYLLGELFGLRTLWLAFPVSESVTFAITLSWLAVVLRGLFAVMRRR